MATAFRYSKNDFDKMSSKQDKISCTTLMVFADCDYFSYLDN
jgi:hypothetical protein